MPLHHFDGHQRPFIFAFTKKSIMRIMLQNKSRVGCATFCILHQLCLGWIQSLKVCWVLIWLASFLPLRFSPMAHHEMTKTTEVDGNKCMCLTGTTMHNLITLMQKLLWFSVCLACATVLSWILLVQEIELSPMSLHGMEKHLVDRWQLHSAKHCCGWHFRSTRSACWLRCLNG